MRLHPRNNGWLTRFALSRGRSCCALCYLRIVALCLSEVALVNAQTRVPPPPGPGTRRTPVVVPPPGPGLGTRRTPVDRTDYSGRTIPMRPKEERSVWFNVAWITAVAALIAAIATLIGSLRKRG